jgi:hypothetical protein
VGVKRSNFRRSKQEIETIIDQEIEIIAKFQEIETIILQNLSGDSRPSGSLGG